MTTVDERRIEMIEKLADLIDGRYGLGDGAVFADRILDRFVVVEKPRPRWARHLSTRYDWVHGPVYADANGIAVCADRDGDLTSGQARELAAGLLAAADDVDAIRDGRFTDLHPAAAVRADGTT